MRPSSPKDVLDHANAPAFLVTDLTNIRFLTGLQLSAGLLLVTPRRFLLFVDGRYREMAERIGGSMVVRDLQEVGAAFKSIGECGFEAEHVTVLRHASWKRKIPSTKFVRKSGIIESFRRQKDDEELRHVRRAQRITKELLRRVPSMLRRPVSEQRLARQLLIWALELGAEGLAFEPIVAFGTHTASPHHHPTTRVLKKGHLVQIDVGAKVNGYCGDMSEMYFTAKPTPLQERIYATLLEAKHAAKDAVQPGATTHELDRIARDILKREGIDDAFTHALGHGVGLDVHEGVTLSQKAKSVELLKYEVITIEPGVYFPGRFGMRVEDMVIVE